MGHLMVFGCACILIASSSQIINFWNKLVLTCLQIDNRDRKENMSQSIAQVFINKGTM